MQTANDYELFQPYGRWKHSPQWKCENMVGYGMFSTVYLEILPQPGGGAQLCAVKRIQKGHAVFNQGRYMCEIDISARVAKHECFVRFLGVNSDANWVYIAMEYMSLGDFMRYIDFRWHEDDAKLVARRLLEGLKFLHGQGITHRDLKPANIFPDPRTNGFLNVKIGDFGVSKRISLENQTIMETRVGTTPYMAPEVNNGQVQYSHNVDCWSVGCIIYRLLAPENLFSNPQQLYVSSHSGELPGIGLKGANCSPICEQFLRGLIEPDPDKRWDVDTALRHQWVREVGRYMTTELMERFVARKPFHKPSQTSFPTSSTLAPQDPPTILVSTFRSITSKMWPRDRKNNSEVQSQSLSETTQSTLSPSVLKDVIEALERTPSRHCSLPAAEQQLIEQNWTFEQPEDIIGEGCGGVVFKKKLRLSECSPRCPDCPPEMCAVKLLDKSLPKRDKARLEREIKIMRFFNELKNWDESSLANKFIVPYLGSYFQNGTLHIVMPYMSQGSLTHYVQRPWDESDTQIVAEQVFAALVFMHSHNVVHRDIKLGNIFPVLDDSGCLSIKVGDFGGAKQINPRRMTMAGSHENTAPEIFAPGAFEYTFVLDSWSVGCLLYRLLTGKDMFRSLRDVCAYKSPWRASPDLRQGLGDVCGEGACKFIDQLIEPEPRLRLSPQRALEDEWLTQNPKGFGNRKVTDELERHMREILQKGLKPEIFGEAGDPTMAYDEVFAGFDQEAKGSVEQ